MCMMLSTFVVFLEVPSCRAPPHDAQVVAIPGGDVNWAERVVAC